MKIVEQIAEQTAFMHRHNYTINHLIRFTLHSCDYAMDDNSEFIMSTKSMIYSYKVFIY